MQINLIAKEEPLGFLLPVLEIRIIFHPVSRNLNARRNVRQR